MTPDPVPLNYLPVLFFLAAAAVFGVGSILAGYLVRPSHPYKAKLMPYESGSPVFHDARTKIPMRYYIIAMLFVIFDIETVFIFPWAVIFNQLGLFGLVEMLVFIAILLVGYFYAWKKGALEWD
jgi:NADH-quinone oxidoreductase subunit A